MKHAAFVFVLMLLCGCAQEERTMSELTFEVSSPAFPEGGFIPVKYTCDGTDMNPPLNVSGLPEGTESLALVVDDPDAPLGTWTHWVVWDIPVRGIDEDSIPGTQGMNSFGRLTYGGPCPPTGTHRYFFKVYALNSKMNLGEGAGKKELLDAMDGHVLAEGQLVGVYGRG